MGKYDPLAQYLASLGKRKGVRLRFREIELILGAELPPSAHKYQSWWGGNSAVWLFEGWRAVPNLGKQRVGFVQDRTAKRLLAERLRPPPPQKQTRSSRGSRRKAKAAARTGTWGGLTFLLVSHIEPKQDRRGIVEDQPHIRYDNPKGLPLHPWGTGPFCRFRIPASAPVDGVYIISVEGRAEYIGETEDLTRRFNNGYGHISPRNCFTGGQSTNCRINSFIMAEAKQGSPIDLWFSRSGDRKALEARLIAGLEPPWNRK